MVIKQLLKKKYRILQIGDDVFYVQHKVFIFWNPEKIFISLESARKYIESEKILAEKYPIIRG